MISPLRSASSRHLLVPVVPLVPGTAPLVSVSGGQDSLFLAWTLFQCQRTYALSPLWLYHNHLWQAEGFFHGLHGLRLAFVFGWPFLGTLPFHRIFDEEAAWDFRQCLRARLCGFYGSTEVFLGHTKTDHLESFLFHLFRGSLTAEPLFTEVREEAFGPSGALVVEKSPRRLFSLEGSPVVVEAPTFHSGAYRKIRTTALV